jgi:hypothetical protein
MPDLPTAPRAEMDRRAALAKEFFEATGAELAPFVTDEATWYDFDYLADGEVIVIIQSHYGVKVDRASLSMPFWSLLDHLNANRRQEG